MRVRQHRTIYENIGRLSDDSSVGLRKPVGDGAPAWRAVSVIVLPCHSPQAIAKKYPGSGPLRQRRKYSLDKLKKHVIIFNMNTSHPPDSVARQILRRSAAHGRGWAFTPQDFADVGDPRVVGMALTRLLRAGKIRRIARGLYDRPHDHPLLGQTGATADTVVAAVARKKNLRLVPSAAVAANQLGLSTQVPAQMVYHTDGAPAKVQLGKLTIEFRRNSGRRLALAGRASGLVAQALRNLGKGKVTAAHLQILRAGLTGDARKQLNEDVIRVPAWMRPYFRELTRSDG